MLKLTLLASCVVLTGCALTPMPFPSQKEIPTFASRFDAAATTAGVNKNAAESLPILKQELGKFRRDVYAGAVERVKSEWDNNSITTYGGLGAVAGALYNRIGLLNTGVAASALGLANGTRANVRQQSQIYIAALKRLACIDAKVLSLSETMVTKAINSTDASAAEAAKNLMPDTVRWIDYVHAQYTEALLGTAASAPTRDEIVAILTKYSATTPASNKGAASLPTAEQAEANKAGDAVKGIMGDIEQCAR